MPKPPSSTASPGPAYSPQPFTWTAITQYYANLTYINNDFTKKPQKDAVNEVGSQRWRDGPHGDKKTPKKPDPRILVYEVEYDTRNDTVMGNLPDLTVRSWLHLAERIGRYKPAKADRMDILPDDIFQSEQEQLDIDDHDEYYEDSNDLSITKKKKEKKKKKKKAINKVWFTFVKRAYVGSVTEEQLHEDFGQAISPS